MTGIDRIPDKQRREFRRKNKIARDLRTPKYKQRVIPKKRRFDDEEFDFEE